MEAIPLLKEYILIFSLILVGYYLIPAGVAFYFFHIRNREKWKQRKILPNSPTATSIRREIKWSISCVAILALLSLVLYEFYKMGFTKMYAEVSEYGWGYLLFSALITIVVYDTYFYWLHRFMHLKWVFPYVHRTHHLSHRPSPFATLAFSPIESALEFGVVPLLVFLIPLHPIALGIFIIYNIVLNTGGHLGVEIVPKKFFSHPILKLGLTVTHHELHHAKVNYNYGIYFNLWDRWMKTNHPDYEKTYLNTIKDSEL